MRLSHVEGAILAGGASTRMGQDKAALRVGGRSLLGRVAATLGTCLEQVSVVLRPGQPLPPDLQLPVITDGHEPRAALVGVCAALRAARAPAVLIAACDLPELSPTVVLALLALVPASGGPDIVAPLGPRGPEPLLAVYRTRLLQVALDRAARAEFSLQDLIRHTDHTALIPSAQLQQIDPELRSLRNVNHPQDLADVRS